MPAKWFRCDTCQERRLRMDPPRDGKSIDECPQCGSKMVRTPRPPSSRVKERLDNGLMEREIERDKDAEDLAADRRAAHERELMER